MEIITVVLYLFCSYATAADNSSAVDLDSWMSQLSEKKECYHDLGCFDLHYPWLSWSRPIPVLPQPAEDIETKFYLLTRKNRKFPQILRTRPVVNLSGSNFRKKEWVFYIVHGYIGHHTDSWVMELAWHLLMLYDGNVILVDWANGANMLNYIQVVANTRLVGAEMARLTLSLAQQGLSEPAKTHALGYSLGAQVIGYMANNITGLHRITAFDPAQPGFEGTEPVVHLDAGDADFVDVIHTNGIPFLPNLGLGIQASIGHVDFFLNGGETQPGCRKSGKKIQQDLGKKDVYDLVQKYMENYPQLTVRVDSAEQLQDLVPENSTTEETPPEPAGPPETFSLLDFLSGQILDLVEYLTCSHKKAPQYFVESLALRNCTFWGVPWTPLSFPQPPDNCTYNTCTEMGMHSILYPGRGSFYVRTNVRAPFCRWKPEVEVVMKNSLADEILTKTPNCK